MSAGAITLVALATGTYALKSAGPLLLGGRSLPAWLQRLAALAPAALLAALVSTSTLTRDGWWSLDARVVGIVAAGVALRYRAPFVLVVVVAATTTAFVRLAGG